MYLLEVKNLSKKYDEKSGIFNFDIIIEPGDMLLLLGPNGAGKTTAFRGILGLTEVQYDKIEVTEYDILNNHINYINNIGAMVSKPVFYEYFTGYEHLKMLGSVYKTVDKKRIEHVLEIVGLLEVKNKVINTYSQGMKQRLDFARAIIHNPKLLILDEPFNGMDIETKYELKKNLKEMQNKNGTGIVISSHMAGDLENIANKVIIVYEGRTLYNGKMETIQKSGLTLEEFYIEKLREYKKVEV